jgi:hypothetical protein
MPLRIHLTNGKKQIVIVVGDPRLKEKTTYDVTYCGQTFATFSGRFEHSVYLASSLQKLIEAGHKKQLCPYCLASAEYAMDMLAKDYE